MAAIKVKAVNKLKVKLFNKRKEATRGNNSVSRDVDRVKKSKSEDFKEERSSMPRSNKRGPPDLMEHQWVKRKRTEGSFISKCSFVLKQLMTHPAGWIFNQPVDPVALEIPDYFSIISNPMDLGTVKSKLEKHLYFGAEEFAADIRLTFSNAMLYNPRDNEVHKLAVDLSKFFEAKWVPLKKNWNHDSLKIEQHKHSSGLVKEMNDARKEVDKGSRSCSSSLLERLMISEEFHKGAKSALHEENTRLSSQPTPLATNVAPEGRLICDVQPCSNQELCAAMLKSRYAGIIAKAQQTFSDHGKISHPLKMQREKRRFKSIQREEINKIKYQMQKRDDVAAAATKLQREKEREATRVALRQMTKTVDLYDNIWVQREFDALMGSKDSYNWPQAVL